MQLQRNHPEPPHELPRFQQDFQGMQLQRNHPDPLHHFPPNRRSSIMQESMYVEPPSARMASIPLNLVTQPILAQLTTGPQESARVSYVRQPTIPQHPITQPPPQPFGPTSEIVGSARLSYQRPDYPMAPRQESQYPLPVNLTRQESNANVLNRLPTAPLGGPHTAFALHQPDRIPTQQLGIPHIRQQPSNPPSARLNSAFVCCTPRTARPAVPQNKIVPVAKAGSSLSSGPMAP
eukprot:Platyproteum_vivax@DN3882_c0_g1_i1.p1